MPIIEQDSQPFEPYARLMNIIGDQLITDKKVAVIELIKNSYDADASNVEVRFFNTHNMGLKDLSKQEEPYIEIWDDGCGMSLETIKNVWLRPATPEKFNKKKENISYTQKNRIIQGEKGVGRFSIHKLGEYVELYTKTLASDEVKVVLNFADYNPDDEELFQGNQKSFKLLKDVKNSWFVISPPEKIKRNGTLIRIYNLRENWYENDFKELYSSIERMIPINDPNHKFSEQIILADFTVSLLKDSQIVSFKDLHPLQEILRDAPFTIFGSVSESGFLDLSYSSSLTNRVVKKKFNILNQETDQDRYPYVLIATTKNGWFVDKRLPICGGFKFTLYAYDLNDKKNLAFTKEVREIVKRNFVYVFRDGVRIYPFGERGFDWLDLDKLRSVWKAGDFPSYQDIVGFVYISQSSNPQLQDTSNRQGLMNVNGAYDDFKNLVLSVVQIFNYEIRADKTKQKIEREKANKEPIKIVNSALKTFISSLDAIENHVVIEKAGALVKSISDFDKKIRERILIVEDLAGVGMAVEKSSHDTFMLLAKLRNIVQDFQLKVKGSGYTESELEELLVALKDSLAMIYEELQIIQPLFKFQRKEKVAVSLKETINKVIWYFRRDIEGKIKVTYDFDGDLVIKTNRGLIMQTLINIVDNSVYWLNQGKNNDRRMSFKISTSNKTLIVADNGPGVPSYLTEEVFQEFFSLKSEGRGLGLYIVREILLRVNATIRLIDLEKEKLLPGANFKINFNKED
jgi:signal transduction histidine kinase